MSADIVIPLGNGSPFDNEELRFALRSVERFVEDRGQVWILSDCAPDWLQNVRILPVPDQHRGNKDANILDKLIFASKVPEVSETFIFLSDDQAFLAPFHAETAKTVFNPRSWRFFAEGSIRWHRRMMATFAYLAERGIRLPYNFDAHVPVVYRKQDFQLLKGVDYVRGPGFCVNTLLCGLLKRRGELPQAVVKAHVESGDSAVNMFGKQFAGYNNAGFPVLRPYLQELFPEKSRYES